MKTGSAKDRPLLTTTTKEPFQPVRLYYSIPDSSFVLRKLKKLVCLTEVPPENCWQWLYHAETASLRFGYGGYEDVPEKARPIVLGRIRFPSHGRMTLETGSVARVIEGARFFGPRLGPKVVAVRCRLVNRLFRPDEGSLDQLLATLDHDVTVIDPREAEAEFERLFKGVRTREEAERAAAQGFEERLKRGDDVPMVEDFPLAPEEESPDFRELATTLQFRLIRAFEHWQGNTHLTLPAIIRRAVEDSVRAGGVSWA